MDKREGGGSHNWGTFEDEMKAEEDKNNVSTDAEKTESGDKPEGEKEKEGAPEEPREEEPKTFTLDEWKKQQAKKDDKPKFNTRKAGEGSDIDPKWKKTYAYKKEKETVHDDDDDEVIGRPNSAFGRGRSLGRGHDSKDSGTLSSTFLNQSITHTLKFQLRNP